MMKHWPQEFLTLINRDFLPEFLTSLGLVGPIVEVGTYRGEFAEKLATGWSGPIVCVDPWRDLPESEYRDGCANGGKAGGRILMDEVFRDAIRRLHRFGERITIMRDRSHEAAEAFPLGKAAAVYIDGNHAYEHAFSDLRLWWKRVKPGGILGIHDCYTRMDEVQIANVADAVWDFSAMIEQRPFLTSCTSAWWRKSE